MSHSTPHKPITASRTTGAQIAGGTIGAGTVLAVLVAARQVAPDLVPWCIGADAGIAVLYNVFAAPIISRKIKPWLKKRAQRKASKKAAKEAAKK